MAGLSRRFTEAGYTPPKYMLPLPGGSVFAHAVGSFAAYFGTIPFLFIARDVAGTADFLARECTSLGIRDYAVQMLNAPTGGQAETVELGLQQRGVAGDMPITIFNIDTFRPGFRFPDASWFSRSGGYLEVFRGSGDNWSYVRPALGDEPAVLETAEKRPISDLCCTGLYHFAAASDFTNALKAERCQPTSAELYVAPLYNHMLAEGRCIHYHLLGDEQIIHCGLPCEYKKLLNEDGLGNRSI
jgi:hypothetical protein